MLFFSEGVCVSTIDVVASWVSINVPPHSAFSGGRGKGCGFIPVTLEFSDDGMEEMKRNEWRLFIEKKARVHQNMLNFLPPFERSHDQSQASWDEQCLVRATIFQKMQMVVQHFLRRGPLPSSTIVEGPPGSAKSFLMLSAMHGLPPNLEIPFSGRLDLCRPHLWENQGFQAPFGHTRGFPTPRGYFWVTSPSNFPSTPNLQEGQGHGATPFHPCRGGLPHLHGIPPPSSGCLLLTL